VSCRRETCRQTSLVSEEEVEMRRVAIVFTAATMAAVGPSLGAAAALAPLDVPILYAATAPVIAGFSPSSGRPGDTITITGVNLNGAQRVIFSVSPTGPRPGWLQSDATFTIVSSTTITAQVPPNPNGSDSITVVTPRGMAVSRTEFFSISLPPPPVIVPNVVGQSLQAAYQTLQQSGLKVGTISGATGFSLTVIAQSPTSGNRVQSGSAVNLTVATAASGVSSVTLTNALPFDESVYVWAYDYSTGIWYLQNSGSLLLAGQSVTIRFQAQGSYLVADVDSSCGNYYDPSYLQSYANCVPWQQSFTGNPQGPPFSGPMD
jgi:hypothetical protein